MNTEPKPMYEWRDINWRKLDKFTEYSGINPKDSCKNNLNSFFDRSYISQFIPDKICTTYFYMAPKFEIKIYN
ncbi:hypothetical protein D5R40_14710 [Okeania hirsuta]|uniref:Uncharacterized protein n=1 Tax=Okeania hirsuta TaxID=1458930 RepID=A0A3N6QJ54_9CYAN|nr:hypothetical protein D5R40_14710 [Okeania hirsuta]